MLFITNALGDVGKAFPSQVHQFSNNASEIILLAPIGGAATCSFVLPNGARTTPELLTPDGELINVKFGDELKSFYAWRSVLPYSVTEYSGTVRAQFSIYTGTQTITTSAISFSVENGANSLDPGDPPGDPSDEESFYSKIMSALGDLSNKYNLISEGVSDIGSALDTEERERKEADNGLNVSISAVSDRLYNEVAARESLQNDVSELKIDVETELANLDADKLEKVTDFGILAAYAANAFGGQTMIPIKEEPDINTIAYRTRYGTVKTSAPQEADDATPMQYVDDKSEQTLSKAKDYTDMRFSQFDLVVFVSALPATGEKNKLYLITKENGEDGDLFEEYLWVKGAWELQGSARIDLSGYATTAELTEGLARKLDEIKNADEHYDFAYLAKKNNGGTTIIKVDTGDQGYTIAKRTSTGALAVSTPTEDNHATPKKYVDAKTEKISFLIDSLFWDRIGQIGPDATNDIAWGVPLSSVGITGTVNAFFWCINRQGSVQANGIGFTGYRASAGAGKVQITYDGKLVIVGANTPAQDYWEYSLSLILLK